MHGKTITFKIVSMKPILVITITTRDINVLIITLGSISMTNTKIAMIMHIQAGLVSIFSVSQTLFVVADPILERLPILGSIGTNQAFPPVKILESF